MPPRHERVPLVLPCHQTPAGESTRQKSGHHRVHPLPVSLQGDAHQGFLQTVWGNQTRLVSVVLNPRNLLNWSVCLESFLDTARCWNWAHGTSIMSPSVGSPSNCTKSGRILWPTSKYCSLDLRIFHFLPFPVSYVVLIKHCSDQFADVSLPAATVCVCFSVF